MAEKVILYSTGCPKCEVLKRKLQEAGIRYEAKTGVKEMLALGITNVPVLRLGDKMLGFHEAVTWINKRQEW